MARLGNKMPDAIFQARIIIRIVWRCYSTHRCGDFVLATAFLTIVSIFVKRKSVVTRALIRAYCVSALVLTTAIVGRTLVHVGEEYCSKTSFLDTAITHGMKCIEGHLVKRYSRKKDILRNC